MNTKLISLFLIVLFSFQNQAQNIEKVLYEKYNPFLKNEQVNAVVLINHNGKTETISLGETNGKRYDEHSVFNIGSATKTMTSVLILQEAERGNLKLNDAVVDYLPHLPNINKDVTIEQMLRHESGLGEIIGANFMELAFDKADTQGLNDLVTKIPEPYADKKHRYTNTNYLLLGLILEKVTGKSYYDLLEKRIFKPCKMAESYPFLTKNIKNLALPVSDGKIIIDSVNFKIYNTYPFAAGSVASTLSDMQKFYQTLYETNKLINKQSFKLLTTSTDTTDRTVKYCLGLINVKHNDGYDFYGHNGDNIGYSFRNYFDINNKSYIIAFGNEYMFTLNYSIQKDALDYIKGKKIEYQPINNEVVNKLKGEYIVPETQLEFEILTENNLPYINILNRTEPLFCKSDSLYNKDLSIEISFTTQKPNTVGFAFNKDNHIAYLKSHLPDDLKTQNTTDINKFKSYFGTYKLDDIGLEFELKEKDNLIIMVAQGADLNLQESGESGLKNSTFNIDLEFNFDINDKITFKQNGTQFEAKKVSVQTN